MALSLLYRSMLVDLAERRDLVLPESATEFECLRAVQATQAGGITRVFDELTQHWIASRYAGASPAADAFEGICAKVGDALVATGAGGRRSTRSCSSRWWRGSSLPASSSGRSRCLTLGPGRLRTIPTSP